MSGAWLDRLTVLAHQMNDFSTTNTEHHAAATGSVLETVMVVGGWAVVALVTAFTIRYLISPGEKSHDHVKRMVLDDELAARP